MRKRVVEVGDVFSIQLRTGNALFQVAESHSNYGELIRVFGIGPNATDDDFETLVKSHEEFVVFFPARETYRAGKIDFVCNVPLPNWFQKPTEMKSTDIVKGEFRGWMIVDIETLRRRRTLTLSEDERNLSPFGTWTFGMLKHQLETGFTLAKWSESHSVR